MKLAIITTHPIQYYDPVFKLIAESGKVDLKVFYTWGEASNKKHDPGFGKVIEWDIPLLEGYPFEFIINTAKDPGTHHFWGIKNPNEINQIDRFNPDILLIVGWGWYSHLKIIRYYKDKVPIWFRGDSTLLDQKIYFKSLFRTFILKYVYSYIDKAFFVGKANKAYFLKYGLKENQLIFAPHAIDNSRFGLNRSKEAIEIRQELKLCETDILILFAGKLEIKKDPLLLLEAFVQIAKPNTNLLFLGNGILEAELKSKVRDENIERVYFKDFQNQQILPAYYQACNLFCLPSKGSGESWGLSVNEAMACGKAVLVSDKVGCAADLVKPGINGAIFEAHNRVSLIEKLLNLTDDPQKLIKYGRESKELIQNWSFKHIADTIIRETTHKSYLD